MERRIVMIQGHPDTRKKHFGHALAEAYLRGAEHKGHEVRTIEVATLQFDWLRRQEDWNVEAMSDDIKRAQADISWANHIVLVFPLWMGTMPAIVKAFLENALCEGFALENQSAEELPGKKMKGKSARIVVTMGMPAVAYRVFYRSHSVKSLERNILRFCGFKPVRCSIFGGVDGSEKSRTKYLETMEILGAAAV